MMAPHAAMPEWEKSVLLLMAIALAVMFVCSCAWGC